MMTMMTVMAVMTMTMVTVPWRRKGKIGGGA
jgi:hypothetical protein